MGEEVNASVLNLTAKIVSAHIGKNQIAASELPEMIRVVYSSLTTVGIPKKIAVSPAPAVPIRKSVFADHLICLEDGKKLTMLKRYLQARYGLTPQDYREKWELPADYPMVAPNYARHRSAMARLIGLGRRSGNPDAAPADENVQPDMPAEPSVRRIRARRAHGWRG